jgi:hypothetical protein
MFWSLHQQSFWSNWNTKCYCTNSHSEFIFGVKFSVYPSKTAIIFWTSCQCSQCSDWVLAGQSRVWSLAEAWVFPPILKSRPVLGPTQTPIQWILGVASPGVKRPQREGNHSPRSSVELTNLWSSFSTPPYAFMTCRGTTLLYGLVNKM